MTRLSALGITAVCLLGFSSFALADMALPPCMVGNLNLAINNAQISHWKTSTPNQYLARGHVHGRITRLFPDHSGHAHFEVSMDGGVNDTLEAVYDLKFGSIPHPAIGMEVEACGDYITSNLATRQYPRSPDDAIIHWIHRSDNLGSHPDGFLVLDGQLYGQSLPGHPFQ
jgi:hypothetical protein